jgi:hypothetical protein
MHCAKISHIRGNFRYLPNVPLCTQPKIYKKKNEIPNYGGDNCAGSPHTHCLFMSAIMERMSEIGTKTTCERKGLIIANTRAHTPITELNGLLTTSNVFPGFSFGELSAISDISPLSL